MDQRTDKSDRLIKLIFRNLTAMRERLEKMQEAGEDIDDEQAAIIEQLEDLNVGMDHRREEEHSHIQPQNAETPKETEDIAKQVSFKFQI